MGGGGWREGGGSRVGRREVDGERWRMERWEVENRWRGGRWRVEGRGWEGGRGEESGREGKEEG